MVQEEVAVVASERTGPRKAKWGNEDGSKLNPLLYRAVSQSSLSVGVGEHLLISWTSKKVVTQMTRLMGLHT